MIKIIFSTFMVLFAVSISLAQNNYSIIGDGNDIVFIFRFEVIDSQSHWPIMNSRITLKDEPSKRTIFSVFTNSEGIAVVIVKGKVGNIPGVGKMKIIAQGYRYAEKEIVQWDLLQNYQNTRIKIPTANWKINHQMVIDAILQGKYEIYHGSFFSSEKLVSVGDYYVEMELPLEKIKSTTAPSVAHLQNGQSGSVGQRGLSDRKTSAKAKYNEIVKSEGVQKSKEAIIEAYTKLHPLAVEILIRTATKLTEDKRELAYNVAMATLTGGESIAPIVGLAELAGCVELLLKEGLINMNEVDTIMATYNIILALEGVKNADDALSAISAISAAYGSGVEVGIIDEGKINGKLKAKIKADDEVIDLLVLLAEGESSEPLSKEQKGRTATTKQAIKTTIGIAVRNISKEKRERVKQDMGYYVFVAGVDVVSVEPSSAAYKAGLSEKMVITSLKRVRGLAVINETPTTAEKFENLVSNFKPGDQIMLSIWRQSEGNNIDPKYAGAEEKGKWYQTYIPFTYEPISSAQATGDEELSNNLPQITNSIGMKFVLIPAGSFTMGSPPNEKGRFSKYEKQHNVEITKRFYIQTTEVTQGQWYEVMGTRPWSGKNDVNNDVNDNPDHPVAYITWNDCKEFVRKINQKEKTNKYRLPTEVEWEYACRAGTTTRFYFGNSESMLGDYAWYDKNARNIGEGYAHKVGSKKPNAWGLYDMHGNVGEWCEDIIKRSRDSLRVVRGCSFNCGADGQRSAFRILADPECSYGVMGFRLVRML